MQPVRFKHPLAIRWFHWINFPVLAVMIWSGLLIYWANDVYYISVGGKEYIRFFPDSFNEALHLKFRLAEGMAWHFALMWLFFINGFLYVTYTIISGEWRYLLPTRKSWGEALQVVLHDLHLRRSAPNFDKYNAAQRVAYSGVVLMGFGSLLTGLAIYKPVQFPWLCWVMGGYESARVIHFGLTVAYVLFFVVHIIQVMMAGWQAFSAMLTGWEVEKEQLDNNQNTPSA
ncbi:MAG: cytochrome b/b6 domain-containing protein [Chitinophagales bacterium]